MEHEQQQEAAAAASCALRRPRRLRLDAQHAQSAARIIPVTWRGTIPNCTTGPAVGRVRRRAVLFLNNRRPSGLPARGPRSSASARSSARLHRNRRTRGAAPSRRTGAASVSARSSSKPPSAAAPVCDGQRNFPFFQGAADASCECGGHPMAGHPGSSGPSPRVGRARRCVRRRRRRAAALRGPSAVRAARTADGTTSAAAGAVTSTRAAAVEAACAGTSSSPRSSALSPHVAAKPRATTAPPTSKEHALAPMGPNRSGSAGATARGTCVSASENRNARAHSGVERRMQRPRAIMDTLKTAASLLSGAVAIALTCCASTHPVVSSQPIVPETETQPAGVTLEQALADEDVISRVSVARCDRSQSPRPHR